MGLLEAHDLDTVSQDARPRRAIQIPFRGQGFAGPRQEQVDPELGEVIELLLVLAGDFEQLAQEPHHIGFLLFPGGVQHRLLFGGAVLIGFQGHAAFVLFAGAPQLVTQAVVGRIVAGR